MKISEAKSIAKKIIDKEESLIYDLEKDFKNNQVRFVIKLFSEFGSSFVLLFLYILIGFIYGFEVFSLIVMVYVFQLCMIEVIKFVFKRKRPKTFKNDLILGKKIQLTTGSFPSGHTSNAFCTALLLSLVFNTPLVFTSLFFAIAGSVAMSRIFLGKHFILDVIGGAILGMTLTIIGVKIYELSYSLIFLS